MFLDYSVKFLVQEGSHSLGESLLEFEFDADIAVVGETGVTIRDASVSREIEDEHE